MKPIVVLVGLLLLPVPQTDVAQTTKNARLVENLTRRGVPVEYILFPDEGHGLRNETNRIMSTLKMVEFFVAHLVDRPAATAANGFRR
jgi:prolyl oligopeptidase family protein